MSSLFESDMPRRPEVVAGLFREAQIVTIAGAYNVGKTPLLAQLGFCMASGHEWCGRVVKPKHIVHIDFESSVPDFIHTYRNIARAAKSASPKTPTEIEPYLCNAGRNKETDELDKATSSLDAANKFLRERLKENSNSVFLIDPAEMFFANVQLGKPDQFNRVVRMLRSLFSDYPESNIISTHNLRKLDVRAAKPPDLIEDPHGWLREISGSNNLLNRSDVRIGMDRYSADDLRVISGIRRGEDMHPMFMFPIEVDNNPEELGGFRQVRGTKNDLTKALGPKMLEHFLKLPVKFHFNEIADNGIPRTSLYKVLRRAESLGCISKINDLWVKID